MSKLPALTPDDPLRAPPETSPPPPPAPASPAKAKPNAAPPRQRTTRRRAAARQPAAPPASPEAEWSGVTDVTTLRLPAEVLQALHERSRQLGVAKGMTVAAALIELLHKDDAELVELIEHIQQRYDTARRRARRAA